MRKHLDHILQIILVTLMMMLLLTVIWQVFSRYVLQDPSSITDELARYLLIWVSLLGAAYATGKKLHLSIDLLKSKYDRPWLDQLILLVILIFSQGVLLVGGVRLVRITLQLGQQSSALQIPLGYVYVVLPLSGVLILMYVLLLWKDSIHSNR